MQLKIAKWCVCSFVALSFLFSNAALGNSAMTLKTAEMDWVNQQLNRPAKVLFWYQSSGEACDAKLCLPKAQDPNKVAVISHGAFGSPQEMNWLGYALASQGWVVAGVAHFGESWMYGGNTIDPSTAMRFWQRPQDVSFAIDALAEPGLFSTPLNNQKVLMLGHSAGGFTSLAMAGAQLSDGKSETYCASAKAKGDKGCMYGKQSQRKPMSAAMLEKIGKLQSQMQDSRVALVIALDPALGHTVNEQSLQNIKVPTLIVGSVENDFLPFANHAQHYAKHIADARLVGIEQGAGHFIYIDQCDSKRAVNGVPLCKDREGVERKKVQQQILNHIFGFIYKNSAG